MEAFKSHKGNLSNISWIIGIGVILGSIHNLIALQIIPGILYMIAGLLILPPSVKFYENKFNIQLNRAVKVIVFIGLIYIGNTVKIFI